jgi:hypothetical protein
MILASAPTAYGRGGFNLTPIPFPIGPPPPPFSATLDNRYMFDSYMSYYLPTITNGSINLRVGMEKLVDKRPDKDRSVTEKIADVDAIVSARLLKDFQVDQVFAAIDSPDKKEDDLIMSGEIRRFYWKWSGSLISLIPPINLLTFFGLPRYHAKGIAEVYIRLVSFKTGRVLAEYDKISTKTESYTIYNESTADYCSGRELAAALKDVSNQIREAIVLDIEEGRLKIPE